MLPPLWDYGSAYDLFASLYILHHPNIFGVRPAWAAGVRSRLPANHRKFLESAFSFFPVPLGWLYRLPIATKNSSAVLEALAAIPPARRLSMIMGYFDPASEAMPIWNAISERGRWDQAQADTLRDIMQRTRIAIWPGAIQKMCAAFAQPGGFGDQLLDALRVYCNVYFFEEEGRIEPVIQASLQAGQKLSGEMAVENLLEHLVHGITLDLESKQVVLVPSFWAGPLIFYSRLSPEKHLILYGGRPEGQPLIPGEDVPEVLLSALKALADPTRLQILRFLSIQSLTLTELSQKLRLRPPTVVHHLYALRLAHLVQVAFLEKGERRYTLRRDDLKALMDSLDRFLEV